MSYVFIYLYSVYSKIYIQCIQNRNIHGSAKAAIPPGSRTTLPKVGTCHRAGRQKQVTGASNTQKSLDPASAATNTRQRDLTMEQLSTNSPCSHLSLLLVMMPPPGSDHNLARQNRYPAAVLQESEANNTLNDTSAVWMSRMSCMYVCMNERKKVFVQVRMCKDKCIQICIRMHIYVCVCACVCVCVRVYLCVCVCMHVYVYARAYTHKHYIRTYVHTYIRTYIHTYIHTCTHTHIYIYMYTHIYTNTLCLQTAA